MTTGINETISRIFDTFSVVSKSRYSVVYDIFHHYARWSVNAVEYFDLPGEYVSKADEVWEQRIHPEDLDNYHARFRDLLTGIAQEQPFEYRARNKSGEFVACSSRAAIIRDYSGKPAYLAFSIINHGVVTNTDPITRTENLYEFYNVLRKRKARKQSSIVLLIDTIRFEDINHSYGYMFGNDVLKAAAELLINLTRNQGDVYRADGTGLIFSSETMSLDEVRKLYARMRTEMKNAFYVSGTRVTLSIAGGVVIADNFEIDEHVIYTNAKYVLEISKERNHGGLVIYHNENQDKSSRRLELADTLRSDIANRCAGFYLCYQPVISAADESLSGAEVLLRWNKAPFGELMPDEFVPWLENDSSFFKLGNWILEQAFIETSELLAAKPDFMLGINLTYMQLERSEFRTSLMQILRRTRFPARNLTIELTRRCRMMSSDHLKSQVDFLKACGCRIAVDADDFAALDLIRILPVDRIKLDRKFMSVIETSQVDQYMVEAITGFARNMNIQITMTGVEDEQKMRFIRSRYPADSFQGYYYSIPVRIGEMRYIQMNGWKK